MLKILGVLPFLGMALDSCITPSSVSMSVDVSTLKKKVFEPFESRASDGYCISSEFTYKATKINGSTESILPPWADFDPTTMTLILLPHSTEEVGSHTLIIRGGTTYGGKYFEAATYVYVFKLPAALCLSGPHLQLTCKFTLEKTTHRKFRL